MLLVQTRGLLKTAFHSEVSGDVDERLTLPVMDEDLLDAEIVAQS